MKLLIRILVGVTVVLALGTYLIFPNIFSLFWQKVYWLELVFLLLITFGWGISNTFILKIALVLTFLGGLLNVLVFNELAETSLRIGLVFWTVGIIKTLINYRK